PRRVQVVVVLEGEAIDDVEPRLGTERLGDRDGPVLRPRVHACRVPAGWTRRAPRTGGRLRLLPSPGRGQIRRWRAGTTVGSVGQCPRPPSSYRAIKAWTVWRDTTVTGLILFHHAQGLTRGGAMVRT